MNPKDIRFPLATVTTKLCTCLIRGLWEMHFSMFCFRKLQSRSAMEVHSVQVTKH